jgi:hypothetical protein
MSFGPGDSDPSQSRGGEALAAPPPAARPVALKPVASNSNSASPNQSSSAPVTFDQGELRRLFSLYGRKVAAGEWRDYAIDFMRDRAVFSVFRRACEVPLYRIEKNPRLARRQGAYSVISATGLIVRRGHELDRVLGSIDRSLRVVAG